MDFRAIRRHAEEMISATRKRHVVVERSAHQQRHAPELDHGMLLLGEIRHVENKPALVVDRERSRDHAARRQGKSRPVADRDLVQRLDLPLKRNRSWTVHCQIARKRRRDLGLDVLGREEARDAWRERAARKLRVRRKANAVSRSALGGNRSIRVEHAVLARAPLGIARARPAAGSRPLLLDALAYHLARKAGDGSGEDQKFGNRAAAVAVVAPAVGGDGRRGEILERRHVEHVRAVWRTFRPHARNKPAVAVHRSEPVSVRGSAVGAIAAHFVPLIAAVEMIRARILDHLVLAVGQEECVLVAHDVHRPEYGADVREAREIHVDVGAVGPHQEGRHAVRVAVRAGIAGSLVAVPVERCGLHEVCAGAHVLPA